MVLTGDHNAHILELKKLKSLKKFPWPFLHGPAFHVQQLAHPFICHC
jgi:hypothetical protein